MPVPEMVPQSISSIRIGKHVYPVKSEPNCVVCQSPHRYTIERDLSHGHSYKSIRQSLAGETPPPPEEQSIGRHVARGHMTIQQTSQRLMIEQRAEEMGKSIEDGAESLLDAVSVNRAIVEAGFRRLADGELQPSMQDLLTALKLQVQIDAATPQGSIDNEVWMEAMMEYLKIAQRLMPSDMWAAFGAELATSPVMKAIQTRMTAPVRGEVMGE